MVRLHGADVVTCCHGFDHCRNLLEEHRVGASPTLLPLRTKPVWEVPIGVEPPALAGVLLEAIVLEELALRDQAVKLAVAEHIVVVGRAWQHDALVHVGDLEGARGGFDTHEQQLTVAVDVFGLQPGRGLRFWEKHR